MNTAAQGTTEVFLDKLMGAKPLMFSPANPFRV